MSCWYVIRVHFKMSTLFVVSHFLSAQGSPEWRSNPGFGTPKMCPDAKIMWTFLRDQILSPLNVRVGGGGGGGVIAYKRLTGKCRWMVRNFKTAIMDKSLGTLLHF